MDLEAKFANKCEFRRDAESSTAFVGPRVRIPPELLCALMVIQEVLEVAGSGA